MVMSPLDQHDDINAKVKLVLKEAGLDASPMDPASMEALKEFMLEMPNENDPFAAVVENRNHKNRKAPPLLRVEQSALQRRISDLTQGADTFAYNNGLRDHDSNASTAGSTGGGASPMEQKILDQLHQQTELIWQLHRRIETLTTTVENLATTGGDNISSAARETRANATQAPPRVRRREALLPRVVPGVARPVNGNPDQQVFPPLPENPPARGGVPVLNRVYNSLAAIANAVRNSRMAKIAKVYVALRQREAPNFDLLLIFKVLVMVTIFMTRMSSQRKNTESFIWMYRTYLIGSFIVVGFLLKTGYLKFMHAFIVKDNYPGRIWNGEEIDIDNLPPAGIVRRPVAARNAGPLEFLRRTLLAGRIPRMDPARRGAVVLNAIQDLFCLVGSFFLSIFPMWAPEAPQPAQRRGPPAAPPAHFQQRLAELQQQQQELEQQQEQEQQQQLPGVQPPADAFEAEADDNAD